MVFGITKVRQIIQDKIKGVAWPTMTRVRKSVDGPSTNVLSLTTLADSPNI